MQIAAQNVNNIIVFLCNVTLLRNNLYNQKYLSVNKAKHFRDKQKLNILLLLKKMQSHDRNLMNLYILQMLDPDWLIKINMHLT